MKLQHYIYLPLILVVYIAFMAYITYDGVEGGEISLTSYLLTHLGTLCVIIALFFVLKRRDKLRNEREEDIKKNQKNK